MLSPDIKQFLIEETRKKIGKVGIEAFMKAAKGKSPGDAFLDAAIHLSGADDPLVVHLVSHRVEVNQIINGMLGMM